MPLLSDFRFLAPGLLQGHVCDPDLPALQWHIGLYLNDRLCGTFLADQPDPTSPVWPPDCGFEITLLPGALTEQDRLQLWVLNTAHCIARLGTKDLIASATTPVPPPTSPPAQLGQIRHQSGLTLTGRIGDGVTTCPSYDILALEAGRVVGRSPLWRWQHAETPQQPLGRAVEFELLLDAALADGQPHRIEVLTSTGQTLGGSPLDVLALPPVLRQQLQTAAAEDPRNDAVLDRLFGCAMPFSAYATLYPKLAEPAPPAQGGTIGSDGRWQLIGQTGWRLCHHAALQPSAEFLQRLPAALASADPMPALVLADLAVRMEDGGVMPLLFSAFDLERLLEQGHAGLCFALPSADFDPGFSSLIALLLHHVLPAGRSFDRGRVLHLPHPAGLISEQDLQRSTEARAAALQAALRSHIGFSPSLPPGTTLGRAAPPRRGPPIFPALHLHRPAPDNAVSVIIPSRDHGAMLEHAVNGLIAQNPGFTLDILVVDHGSQEPASHLALNRLEARGIRILEYAGGFNFAQINNLACEHARHEQLCFMNNDVEFPSAGLLAELTSRLADPGIGAVGPVMIRASQLIQHGGVALGPFHVAVHAFEDRLLGDPGPAEMLRIAHEPSALTAAFLLTRRSLFQAMNGFDEQHFPVNFNDVDYCLRLAERGLRVVLTPHVALMHRESTSRGRETGRPEGSRRSRELANLRTKWREVLLDDPQYHPLLAPDQPPWRALATSHRAPQARRASPRPAHALPDWL